MKKNRINSNQNGVIHHLALFVLVGLVLAGVGFAGWRVWSSRDEASAAGTGFRQSANPKLGNASFISKTYRKVDPQCVPTGVVENGAFGGCKANLLYQSFDTISKKYIDQNITNKTFVKFIEEASDQNYSATGLNLDLASGMNVFASVDKEGEKFYQKIHTFDPFTNKRSVVQKINVNEIDNDNFCVGNGYFALHINEKGLIIGSLKGGNYQTLKLPDNYYEGRNYENLVCTFNSAYLFGVYSSSNNNAGPFYAKVSLKENTSIKIEETPKSLGYNPPIFCGVQFHQNDGLIIINYDKSKPTISSFNATDGKVTKLGVDINLQGNVDCHVSPSGYRLFVTSDNSELREYRISDSKQVNDQKLQVLNGYITDEFVGWTGTKAIR